MYIKYCRSFLCLLLILRCSLLTVLYSPAVFAQSNPGSPIEDERSLLSALISSKTADESRVVISAHRRLLTEALWASLKAETDKALTSADYQHSLFLAEIGKQIADEVKNKRWQTLILNRIAYIHLMMGNYLEAGQYASLCLSALEGQHDDLILVNALLTAGTSAMKLGEFPNALDYLRRTLALGNSLNEKTYIADALVNLGHVNTKTGNYIEALQQFKQAIVVIGILKDDGRLQDALSELGTLYAEQGDYEKAIDYLDQSLKIAQRTEDQRGIASILVTTGIVYREQGKTKAAIGKLEGALKVSEEAHALDIESYARTICASVYRLQGKYQLALDYYKKSLASAEQLGDRELKAGTYWHLAELYNTMSEHARAIEYANDSFSLAKDSRLPEIAYLALTEKGKAHQAVNQFDLAEQSFSRAISIIEELRGQVSGQEPDYQRFLQNRIAPYYSMIDLLVTRGRLVEALAFAERVKARVLLDVLRDGRMKARESLSQEEESKERELHNGLVCANTQLRAERERQMPDNARIKELEERLKKARSSYEEFQTSLYAVHPELRIKRGALPAFTLSDASAAISDGRTAVLEYVVGDSRTLLFVILKGTDQKIDVRMCPIRISKETLARQAENFRNLLATNSPGYRQPARELFDLLIKPAAGYLGDKTTLCIIPDGPLWQLPFQALESPGEKYLLERHAIYYAPSVMVLREMKKRAARLGASPIGKKLSQSDGLFAIANPLTNSEVIAKAQAFTRGDLPPMPETEEEVKRIAAESYRLETSSVLIGSAAREETVKAQIGKYRVLHFATHSVLDDRSPLYSYLLLTTDDRSNEDGLLEAWEIMGMELKASMAVLSACDSARGRVGAGEGLIGMTWALFVAGVPTTVASQWAVPSNSTAKLMVAFHGNAKRLPKAEALRQAALQMIKEQRFRIKPYYWAGFVVVGDGAN